MEAAGVRPQGTREDTRGWLLYRPRVKTILEGLGGVQATNRDRCLNRRRRRPLRPPCDAALRDLSARAAQSQSGGLAGASGRA